jgi:hypothetical protein
MLPTHLPLSILPQLLIDFANLIEKDCEPGTDPRECISGCSPEENTAYLPWECDPEEVQELDPIKRLDKGEELAFRIHTCFLGDPMTLVDGKEYLPAGCPGDGDCDADDSEDLDVDGEWYDFPTEMSFYALGVKHDADSLRIRPVLVSQSGSPAGPLHRSQLTQFPESLLARIESYLLSLH